MGSLAESEPSTTLKLPLFSVVMQDPEPSGARTPPLQTIASVPFRWEEEPGKPRPYTALIDLAKSSSARRSLEPPPRLFSSSSDVKMPSPTTVLDGPYSARSVFQSSSFRMARERHHSFGGEGGAERGQLGRRRLFGGWGRKNHKGKREACRSLDLEEGISAATAAEEDCNGGGKMTSMRRSGSSLSLSNARSHFWASVYEGLKQVMPWKRTKKLKKDGVLI